MLTGSDGVTGSELSACVRSGWSTEVGLEVSGVGLSCCDERVVGCGGGGREGRVRFGVGKQLAAAHCRIDS